MKRYIVILLSALFISASLPTNADCLSIANTKNKVEEYLVDKEVDYSFDASVTNPELAQRIFNLIAANELQVDALDFITIPDKNTTIVLLFYKECAVFKDGDFQVLVIPYDFYLMLVNDFPIRKV